MVTKAQERLVVAATKLAFGYSIAGHAGLNLCWAESGSNPRDTKADTEIGLTVAARRKELEEEGWEVLAGPSILFARN
jgi:biotin synthase